MARILMLIVMAFLPLAQRAARSRLTEGYPIYHWPFSGMLKERLCREGSDGVWVFTYGSLLNAESAGRTLGPAALSSAQPAIAFGIRRVFNLDVDPRFFTKRYGPPKNPWARAMLNVEEADPTSMVNGLLLRVPFEDLKALCEREVGYDLIPVVVVLWDEREAKDPRLRVAYTLSAPEALTSDHITPVPGYARLVERAAAQYGPAFHDFYLETTYTADGKLLDMNQ